MAAVTYERSSSQDLQNMSIPELVDIYNQIAQKPIKTFRTKADAVRRVEEARAAQAMGSTEVKRAKKKTVSKKTGKKKNQDGSETSGRRGRPRAPFNYEPKDTIKSHREGTKRAQVIGMLREGATIEEIMQATGWKYRDAYEGVKLIHHQVGYGLEEKSTGKIYLKGRP